MEDELYLLKKRKLELNDKRELYYQRKTMYQNMLSELVNKSLNIQERLLLSDLKSLINLFDAKIDIVNIHLKDLKEFVFL